MPEVQVATVGREVTIRYAIGTIAGDYGDLDVERLLAAANTGLEDALRGEIARQLTEGEQGGIRA